MSDEGDKGTGGLFFEPPRAPDDDAAPLGFAPDLDDEDDGRTAALFGAEGAAPAEANLTKAAASARPPRRPAAYPIARAALRRLLGHAEPAPRPGDDGEAFTVGPDIMRAPPQVARPTTVDDDVDIAPQQASTDELMEDMVDMMLVGGDDGQHVVHLAFKEEVFGGLYLKLERRPDGMQATFLVHDDSDRRGVEGHVDTLLSRLRDRGLKISGHTVEVRDD